MRRATVALRSARPSNLGVAALRLVLRFHQRSMRGMRLRSWSCVADERRVFPGFPVSNDCLCFLRYAESGSNPSSDDLHQMVSGVSDSDGIRGVSNWITYDDPYRCYS